MHAFGRRRAGVGKMAEGRGRKGCGEDGGGERGRVVEEMVMGERKSCGVCGRKIWDVEEDDVGGRGGWKNMAKERDR